MNKTFLRPKWILSAASLTTLAIVPVATVVSCGQVIGTTQASQDSTDTSAPDTTSPPSTTPNTNTPTTTPNTNTPTTTPNTNTPTTTPSTNTPTTTPNTATNNEVVLNLDQIRFVRHDNKAILLVGNASAANLAKSFVQHPNLKLSYAFAPASMNWRPVFKASSQLVTADQYLNAFASGVELFVLDPAIVNLDEQIKIYLKAELVVDIDTTILLTPTPLRILEVDSERAIIDVSSLVASLYYGSFFALKGPSNNVSVDSISSNIQIPAEVELVARFSGDTNYVNWSDVLRRSWSDRNLWDSAAQRFLNSFDFRIRPIFPMARLYQFPNKSTLFSEITRNNVEVDVSQVTKV